MVCPILLIAIAAWAAAQALKLVIATAVYRKFDITYLTTGGGMPSSTQRWCAPPPYPAA